jgi:hypothetical protein
MVRGRAEEEGQSSSQKATHHTLGASRLHVEGPGPTKALGSRHIVS